MDKKIFWDEQTGTVYWMEDSEVAFAPMSNDNTCQLGDGGVVEFWENPADEARVKAKLV